MAHDATNTVAPIETNALIRSQANGVPLQCLKGTRQSQAITDRDRESNGGVPTHTDAWLMCTEQERLRVFRRRSD
jgi:hypothetical protein